MPDIALIRELADLAISHPAHGDDIVALILKIIGVEPTTISSLAFEPTISELEILRGEGKIPAIKAHRARTNMGLKESKDQIESAGLRVGILVLDGNGSPGRPCDTEANRKHRETRSL